MTQPYKPRLEALEARCTPTANVAVRLTDSALNIFGDNSRAGTYVAVRLVADTETGEAMFQVDTSLNNGTTPLTSDTYPLRRSLNISTGRGRDFVSFTGSPIETPQGMDLRVRIDLGRGDDTASVQLNGLTVTNGSQIRVSVSGGSGRDVIKTDLAGTVDEGSTFSLSLDGGRDRDNVTVGNELGRLTLDGRMNLSAVGDTSRDRIAADLVFQPLSNKTTQGTFSAYLRGGHSRDNLRLTVANTGEDSGNVAYRGRIDAGPLDTVFTSLGTLVRHARPRNTTFAEVSNELPE